MVTEDIAQRVTSYIQYQATKPRDFILDLVRTSQQRYIDVIANVPDDVAARKPAPGEWSVRELTLHVISAQSMVAKTVHATSRSQRPPERGGIGMTVEDDDRPFASWVDELRSVNDEMLEAIRNLPESPDLEPKPPHPFFGPLNCLEWCVFQRVHDEDHVQHAGKILAAVAPS